MVYLGVVGLLNLIFVHFDLQFVLTTHVRQRIGQLAFKILLAATVHLNHARLVTPLCLPQFLLENYKNNFTHNYEHMFVCFNKQVDADVIK